VKKTLEAGDVPPPAGGRRWSTWVIRRFVLDDVYRPHSFREIERLVTEEVAARLDRTALYGIWWFNRERWTTRLVPESTEDGRVYRRSIRTVPKPREEWIAVPVPGSGVARRVVDAAREAVRANRWNTRGTDRFWELSGGILRCGSCGSRMRTCVTRRKPERVYFYYTCTRHHKDRKACPNRRSYRAGILERLVQRAVSGLLADPDRVREGFEIRIRRERSCARDGPDRRAVWVKRLSEIECTRLRYQAMIAGGLMTPGELGARLEELEAARATVQGELEKLRAGLREVERLERERDTILEALAGSGVEVLQRLPPEERRKIYLMLELAVLIGEDGILRVSAIPGTAILGAREPSVLPPAPGLYRGSPAPEVPATYRSQAHPGQVRNAGSGQKCPKE
jgi:site-specific DNA recombinase